MNALGFLRDRIRQGCLELIDGPVTLRFGAAEDWPVVAVRICGEGRDWERLLDPDDGLCDAYADGAIALEQGSIRDLLALLARNPRATAAPTIDALLPSASASKGDPPAELLTLFLDADLHSSSAYFIAPDRGLDAAQQDKCRQIAAKLLLYPGVRVLEIGSGFGGLAIHLARDYAAEVTGLALSAEQIDYAAHRAAAAGVADRVSFHQRDYRREAGEYDRLVAVGLLQHVGIANYPAFFATCRRLLRPDGVGLIHFLGRTGPPGPLPAWMRKHFVSGDYDVPALSQVLAAIEASGLLITDIQVLGLDYAETARHWYERFQANRSIAVARFGERFCRLWEFGLAAGEMIVRHRREAAIFQVQLAAPLAPSPLARFRRDAIPQDPPCR